MFNKNNLIRTTLIICGAMTLTFISCTDKTPEDVKWETQTVSRRDIGTSVMAKGIIKPKVGAEVRIGSRASGTVTNLYVNVGDYVTKGTLLAELDDAELKAQCEKSKANLYNAEVTLKYAEIELQRMKNLKLKEFISQQVLDDAQKASELANARVLQEKANLDFTNIQLGYTRIYASLSGVIGSVSTQKGETVSAIISTPTFVTIIDLDRLEVWAYVDETDIGRIEEGQPAKFTVDTYPETEFNGIVRTIYPQAEILNNVVNYIVIIEIDQHKGNILRPEMTASINIYMQTHGNVLSIPNKALKRDGNKNIIYILEHNQAVEREVIVGLRGKYQSEIINGIKENEVVIINKK
ncbi:MAG: efflux RND transporter periplasmic adaptor subunit [Bacteroidales bacterium]|jgi:RND family efflux transporter MFP subunit|nr:efflux RND transporter periplasmic adaptor subunit [Bacteroidales bacterium]